MAWITGNFLGFPNKQDNTSDYKEETQLMNFALLHPPYIINLTVALGINVNLC